tara:strand:+ start:10362 stop:10547 length:186 start_codon:yes stop_codon:yes gene_type:complete
MPHSFPGAHDPMVADIIKTLFITITATYLQSQKVPEVYSLVLSVVAVVLYWSFIQEVVPGA